MGEKVRQMQTFAFAAFESSTLYLLAAIDTAADDDDHFELLWNTPNERPERR